LPNQRALQRKRQSLDEVKDENTHLANKSWSKSKRRLECQGQSVL